MRGTDRSTAALMAASCPAAACAWAEEHWDELLDAREAHDNATRLDHVG